MSNRMTKEKLKETWDMWVGKQQVVGYVQMSDAPLEFFWPQPTQIANWEQLHNNDLRFIWEANLHCQKDNTSLTIKQLGNKWLVREDHIDELGKEYIDYSYIVIHKEKNAERKHDYQLKFKEIWQTQQDTQCCGMEVLKPQFSVFVGIERK